jgi:hypothetical protein
MLGAEMTRCARLRRRVPIVGLSTALALAICIITDLIGGWGRWYSHDLTYRRQTDAFIRGETALSHEATELPFDSAWAEGGVQQVWGLGVPAWRFCWELLARIFGQPAFPDRLALAIAIGLSAYIVLTAFIPPEPCRNGPEWIHAAIDQPERLVAALLLILFPPMLTLCSGPFNVYEEPVVYGYYLAIVLFALSLEFARAPRISLFLAIGTAAGLIGFVRPTLFVYGIAVAIITALNARRANWSWLRSTTVLMLLALGGLALFWSNRQRFGAGMEFGHNLNATGGDIMYASRFGAPFEDQPAWRRVRELLGTLFFVNRLNGTDNFQANVVRWQMPVDRWRHFYTRTFDASYLLIICASLSVGVRQLRMACIDRRAKPSEITLASLWSLASIGLLAAFYVRYYSISSRYMLDFAPAMAVSAATLLISLAQAAKTWRYGSLVRVAIVLGFSLWWAVEILLAETAFPKQPPWARVHVMDAMAPKSPVPTSIPTLYELNGEANPWESEILFNGFGWEQATGAAGPLVMLFVQDLSELILDLESPSESASDPMPEKIRARVGLEPLILKSTTKTKRGYRIVFEAPRRSAYRDGVEVIFMAFSQPADFRELHSQWRLTRVRWRTVRKTEVEPKPLADISASTPDLYTPRGMSELASYGTGVDRPKGGVPQANFRKFFQIFLAKISSALW